jgi:pimeloyl-ACP methyl ester carboxylesterase
VLNYTIYENPDSTQWVTFFVHGAEVHRFGSNKSGIFKKQYNVLLLDLRGHGNSKTSLKTAFKQNIPFRLLPMCILEVLDFIKIKNHILSEFLWNFNSNQTIS